MRGYVKLKCRACGNISTLHRDDLRCGELVVMKCRFCNDWTDHDVIREVRFKKGTG